MIRKDNGQVWREVLQFWFPEGRSLQVDTTAHKEHWVWRMRGGAHEPITARFSELTHAVATGDYDHWRVDAGSRLALIIVLDQFSRSVWRDSARSYAQDRTALALTMEGLSNGHYAALPTPWHKVVHGLPLGHCEGSDHLDRLDLLVRLREEIAAEAPAPLQPIYQSLVKQAQDVRKVVAAFGRHPHRNHLLGRPSTPAEEAYISHGKFPHLRAFEG